MFSYRQIESVFLRERINKREWDEKGFNLQEKEWYLGIILILSSIPIEGMMLNNSYIKYKFNSPKMGETNDFELLMENNLRRIGITKQEISSINTFQYLPGTLYPEQGNFSEQHPAGGSFGAHIYLHDGRDAWLYGRVSYDYNQNKDHFNGKPHWNYDIIGISPDGETLPPYTRMPFHGLPDSDYLEISIANLEDDCVVYRVSKI